MLKRVLFIEHDHVSEAGPIWAQFKKRGYEIVRFLIVDEAHFHTPNVKVEWPNFFDFEVIVVMGAPWGAYEDERIGNWLAPEIENLRAAHNAGIPILGICFGGQLMARILGGTVSRSPHAELGWYEIQSDDEAFIPSGPWFQYHWDRFTVPPQGIEIARTQLCPQAFTFGRTLGLQFHPEIDPNVLELWLAMDGGCAEVEDEGIDVNDLRAQTMKNEAGANQRGYDLVDQFLDRIAIAPVQPIDTQVITR